MNKTTLGEIADIITGPFGSQLHKEDYVEEGIPVIMPQNIESRLVNEEGIARIARKDFVRLKRYATQINDLVFARRGDVEKHAFITSDAEMLCGTGCLRVRVTNASVYPQFLSLYLDRPETRKWLTVHAVGSNMQNLNTDILSSVPIELPEYNEQKKIATILQKLDDKVICNNCINNYLQQMAYQTYMYRFYGKKATGKLSDIIIENGKSSIQVGDAKAANSGEYPFFTSGDTVLKWKSPLVSGRNCYINTGGNADVKFYVGNAAYSTDTWCITSQNGLADYLYLMLLSIKPELNQKFFQGTGLKHLQKPLLKDKPIYIPNESEIIAFNKDVQPWFDMIATNMRENYQLIDFRNWLLPILMNGQATITD